MRFWVANSSTPTRLVVSFTIRGLALEDPRRSELGEWLADAFALPLVTSGYETPGSFGSAGAPTSTCTLLALPPSFPVSADEASEKNTCRRCRIRPLS